MEERELMKNTIEYLNIRLKRLRNDWRKWTEIEEQRELKKSENDSLNAVIKEIGIYEHIISMTEMELKLATPWEPMDYQEAHSQVTLEMEMGKEIPLREWARNNGLDESYARQKARRGSLKTAHKVGRDWFISELEINTDNRRKK